MRQLISDQHHQQHGPTVLFCYHIGGWAVLYIDDPEPFLKYSDSECQFVSSWCVTESSLNGNGCLVVLSM